jgi:Tat protein translocase TatB subunit
MFGIGFPELIFIFIVALIVLGPDKLPEVAKQMAKFVMQLKKTAEDFKNEFDKDMGEDLNKLKDIKDQINIDPKKELEEKFKDIYSPVNDGLKPDMEGWKPMEKDEKKDDSK